LKTAENIIFTLKVADQLNTTAKEWDTETLSFIITVDKIEP